MKIADEQLRKQITGCLLGGAVGDALGAPFEGLWAHSIPPAQELLRGYDEFIGFPRGQYTDDTQLTVATVESIISCKSISPADIANGIFKLFRNSAVIGPGGACSLAAANYFHKKDWRNCGAPPGSAGNGTAMRISILAFCFLPEPEKLTVVVSDISRITHQDERSVAGGVAIAKATHLLISEPDIPAAIFLDKIAEQIADISAPFADLISNLKIYLSQDKHSALEFIAWAGMRQPEFESPIITPFVIPTVLASLWVMLRNRDNWANAVAEVIGLGGDVDTLGAIVGGMMGAKLGINAIPQHLIMTLHNQEYLQTLAEKFYYLLSGALGNSQLIVGYS